ncbi:hypothetical protein HK405_012821, partial [Cladochytrium tenue]
MSPGGRNNSIYSIDRDSPTPSERAMLRRIRLGLPPLDKVLRNKSLIYSAAAVGIVVLVALVVLSGVLNTHEANSRQQTSYVSHPPDADQSNFAVSASPLSTAANASFCETHDLVLVYTNVSSVEPNSLSFNLHFLFYPCGKFAVEDTTHDRYNLKHDLNFTVGSTVFEFSSGMPMSSQDYSSTFTSGSPNSYPFDLYDTATIDISASYATDGNGNSSNSSLAAAAVPLQVAVVGALQTFSISLPEIVDTSAAGDGTAVQAVIHVGRSTTTKLFSVFIMANMWLLSLLTFFLALTPWVRAYRVEAPTLAIANTLLW